MLTDSETQIVDRYVEEILSDDNFAVADEILAPDFVIHGLQTLRGRESFIEVQSTVLRKAFPDLTFDVEDMFGDGNKVGVRATIRGTHQGEYLGIAATGRQVEVETTMILRVSDGQIEEVWPVMDSLTWFQQLGAVPTMDWQEEE
ncbi:ester cyclase [Halocatena salina]|uniref:Ester cyclase n=1 Tax=Halocatena salina TaxID=2934340 RepID=A0A8U0A9W6_9EURY|nr:ester cyclase [Halocatena salina]UPM44627.1 ester cyclase [Halocatena salina]